MIMCDCCERRDGDSFDLCKCHGGFCTNCLLCSQHCCCLHSNPTFIVDEEFVLEWDPQPLIPPFKSLPYPVAITYDPGSRLENADERIIVVAKD
jgi:hypothetical protein